MSNFNLFLNITIYLWIKYELNVKNWSLEEAGSGNLLIKKNSVISAILRANGSFSLQNSGTQIFDIASDGKITSNSSLVLGYNTADVATLTGAKINGYDSVASAVNDATTGLATKQAQLVSGTNIKTVGGTSLLGSGNVAFPIVSSVSSSSTNADAVGAKLFYDTCGDIETLINALWGVIWV